MGRLPTLSSHSLGYCVLARARGCAWQPATACQEKDAPMATNERSQAITQTGPAPVSTPATIPVATTQPSALRRNRARYAGASKPTPGATVSEEAPCRAPPARTRAALPESLGRWLRQVDVGEFLGGVVRAVQRGDPALARLRARSSAYCRSRVPACRSCRWTTTSGNWTDFSGHSTRRRLCTRATGSKRAASGRTG